MRDKGLSERTMGTAKLDMLIDYALGDMERRGCTEDSVRTNRRALGRFTRAVDLNAHPVTLQEVTEEVVEEYVSGMQRPDVRFESHPIRKKEAGMLSAFTIRKEVRILKGFGTWLRQEGFEIRSQPLWSRKNPSGS